MKNTGTRHSLSLLVGIAVLVLVMTYPAYAYIDPGTGSFILQLLLAGFFTLVFMLKKIRTRIVDFVTGMFKRKSDEQTK